ncbi:MAG: DUF4258 domain-containing protein [Chlorobium sp.]
MLLLSKHLCEMLVQRNIEGSWLQRAFKDPDYIESCDDGTRHYFKKISENENRWLKVVVNVDQIPYKGVTAFFDRRLREKT